jgi:hypothetical protein
VIAEADRTWLLLAPWYRWRRQHVPDEQTARTTVPVFQKYDTSDCVNAFIKDPQHSLKFVEEDHVQYLERLPDLPALPPPFVNHKRRLSDSHLVTTETRKIYLDTHKRFYLVVCELHCDAPGLPCVDRQKVCEAGFVVRHRRVTFEKRGERSAVKHLRQISAAVVNMSIVDDFASKPARFARHEGLGSEASLVTDALSEAAQRAHRNASQHLLSARQRLLNWADEYGARMLIEGWIPSEHQHVGGWQEVTDPTDVVTESFYPLYPLIPDPTVESHVGKGKTIYFGLLPTGGADVDEFGNPRFDDQALFEVHCFVRRHDPRCPKVTGKQDCHGPLTWSGPTERYRIAPHFDLKGTSNRPVTIQLPDIPALKAQAATLKPGEGAPVKMVSPPGSSFVFPQDGSIPSSGNMGAAGEICSFAIPLITIVATFVLNLFLPIVMLIFGLWFLLKLKFCLPPSASVQAQVTAELAMLPPGVDLTMDIDIKAGVTANTNLQAKLAADLNSQLGGPPGRGAGDKLTAEYTNNVLLHLHQDMATAGTQSVSVTGSLEYEQEEDPALVVIR